MGQAAHPKTAGGVPARRQHAVARVCAGPRRGSSRQRGGRRPGLPRWCGRPRTARGGPAGQGAPRARCAAPRSSYAVRHGSAPTPLPSAPARWYVVWLCPTVPHPASAGVHRAHILYAYAPRISRLVFRHCPLYQQKVCHRKAPALDLPFRHT